MCDLSSLTRVKPVPLELEKQRLNHWKTTPHPPPQCLGSPLLGLLRGQVEQLKEVNLSIIPVNEDRQAFKSLETKGGRTFMNSNSVFEHEVQTIVMVRADIAPEGTLTQDS